MLLIEAGVLLVKVFGESGSPLNELRHACGLGDYDLTGKSQTMLPRDPMERRRELWGEGFSITDILRTQQSVCCTFR